MEIDISFIETTFNAFVALHDYEGKRVISVENLIKFREEILKSALKEYNGEYKDYYESHGWSGEVTFTEATIEEDINTIQIGYSDFFIVTDDAICLKEDADIVALRHLAHDSVSPLAEPTLNYLPKEACEVIGIKSRIKIIRKLWVLEEEIQAKYGNLIIDHTEETKQQLKKLMIMRNFILANCLVQGNQNDTFLGSLNNLASIYKPQTEEYNYPLDHKLYESSEFYETIEDWCSMESRFYDKFQLAIFSDLDLRYEKVDEMILNMMFSDPNQKIKAFEASTLEEALLNNPDPESIESIEDLEELVKPKYNLINPSNKEKVYYMTFIKCLEDYMKNYGDNGILESIKYRLLYAIDDNELLYEPSNFELTYNQLIGALDKSEDFYYFELEAKYFIDEIFVGFSGAKIEKALFVASYYALTKDPEIIERLNKYQTYPNFNNYYEIITGEKRGISRKRKRN